MTRLLITLGNSYRGDDGLGCAVAELVRSRLPANVTLIECQDCSDLVNLWAGASQVVLVDALVSGSQPGTLLRLELSEDKLPFFRSSSTHALGIAEAVSLARTLNMLPHSLVFYGVEAVDFRLGKGLSPAVAGALERLVERILEEFSARTLSHKEHTGDSH